MVKFMKGGNGDVSSAPQGLLSDKSILPSSEFESTGTGGETAKYETAVNLPSAMKGGRRRSKKSKRSTKKIFGWF